MILLAHFWIALEVNTFQASYTYLETHFKWNVFKNFKNSDVAVPLIPLTRLYTKICLLYWNANRICIWLNSVRMSNEGHSPQKREIHTDGSETFWMSCMLINWWRLSIEVNRQQFSWRQRYTALLTWRKWQSGYFVQKYVFNVLIKAQRLF